MLQKNIDKLKRAQRGNQWAGFTTKIEPTKQERLKKHEKKHKIWTTVD